MSLNEDDATSNTLISLARILRYIGDNFQEKIERRKKREQLDSIQNIPVKCCTADTKKIATKYTGTPL